MNKLLKKLIKAASGRTRFIMAVMGLSVALILIFAAVQVQANYDELLHSKTNQDSVANFLVLNKILNKDTYGHASLSNDDISKLKQQHFVEEVGILTPSRYKAAIQSYSDRFPFSTDISFEAVPAEFIDVNSKEWSWNENSNFIPMIAPNMFLDFYNFQFSFSQNLPQLTQDVVKLIVFKVNIETANGTVSFNGRIVGFSDRITSLLVPQSFMDWANQHSANTKAAQQPSRVIIKTKDPGNPLLVQYLKDNGLTTDADKTRFSKYRQIVNVVVNISGGTGIVMLVFALLIFTLFIQLTIASCKSEIELLITLGASPKQLQRFLIQQFYPSNMVIIAAALIIMSVLQFAVHQFLQQQNIFVSQFISLNTIIVAVTMAVVLFLTNYFTIKKYIAVKQ